MVDQGNDQPHKERSEEISNQLAQGASLLSDVEADDLGKIDLRIVYLRRAEFSCWDHRFENGYLDRPCFD